VAVLPVREAGAYPHTKNLQHSLGALPDWDDLRVLLSVVETGSFSRSAKELGLTQPTVSRRVAALEERLGAQLVDRSANGAALTLEGQRIIDELHLAQSAIDRAVSRARRSTPRTETVTLLTSDGLATYWLPYFLPTLMRQNPEIDLRTVVASDASILERTKFDLSIHYLQPNDPNLLNIRLGTLHFVPFASSEYLQIHGRPRTPTELARHTLLDYSLYLIDKGTWMTRLSTVAEEARARVFTNSSSALAECVRKGVGIALLPTYGLLFEQGYEALDLGLNFATPFWLCYHRDALAKPATKVMIHFLKHIFNRRTMPWFADEYIPPDQFAAITPRDVMETYRPVDVPAIATGARTKRA
jgi:molybdate transport repressor ModE-like protein